MLSAHDNVSEHSSPRTFQQKIFMRTAGLCIYIAVAVVPRVVQALACSGNCRRMAYSMAFGLRPVVYGTEECALRIATLEAEVS